MKPIQKMLEPLWWVATSPVTFVGLCLLWCLDLGLGSVVAYQADPQFSARMDAYPFKVWLNTVAPKSLPGSLWVYILVWLTWLMVGSLFLCTINWLLNRRRWQKGLGEVFVHLGFLMIFLGFVVGSVAGTRTQGIVLNRGETRSVDRSALTLLLHQLEQKRDWSGKVLDTVSDLELLSEGHSMARSSVRLNHPLIWKSAVIYPRGAIVTIRKVLLSFEGRPVGPLGEGEEIFLPSGMSFRVDRLVQSGERSGYISGPAVLIRVTKSEGKGLQRAWLTGTPGNARAQLFGTEVSLLGEEKTIQGIYDLHTDPGVQFVLPGVFILGVGTLWSLVGYLGVSRRTGADVARI